MAYRTKWDDKKELLCLLIFKQLQVENFPRGKQIKLCEEMAKTTNLSAGSISAKVCNYKSLAGINNSSNASKNTIRLYDQFKDFSVHKLEELILNKDFQ